MTTSTALTALPATGELAVIDPDDLGPELPIAQLRDVGDGVPLLHVFHPALNGRERAEVDRWAQRRPWLVGWGATSGATAALSGMGALGALGPASVSWAVVSALAIVHTFGAVGWSRRAGRAPRSVQHALARHPLGARPWSQVRVTVADADRVRAVLAEWENLPPQRAAGVRLRLWQGARGADCWISQRILTDLEELCWPPEPEPQGGGRHRWWGVVGRRLRSLLG